MTQLLVAQRDIARRNIPHAALRIPETKWHRPDPDELKVAAGLSVPSSKNEVRPALISDAEKPTATQVMPDLSHAATSQRDPFLGRGTPSKQQFKLYQRNKHPFKTVAINLWTPVEAF